MDYKGIFDKATSEAQDFINDPSKLDALLVQLEEKLQSVPLVGNALAELPVMIAMVKSWIKKEYEVSPKVLAAIVGAFLYLVKKRDLIPDSIPVIGMADDIAVVGLALKFVAPDLEAYKTWKSGGV